MKLFFRTYGEGTPLIILHGLFGQSDNWNTLGKKFAENRFKTYLVDQRNHGLSPHSTDWNYAAMSDDLLELINDEKLHNPILLGHSMGGKTVMQFAMTYAAIPSKIIVADIAPKKYPVQHDGVMDGLLAVNLSTVQSRKEVEETLSKHISDFGTKQFLLKNLYRTDDNKFAWRFNLAVIAENRNIVGETFDAENKKFEKPTLFIRGEKSNYITDNDAEIIHLHFPDAEIITIQNAAHWIHAEQPQAFFDAIMRFLK